MSVRYQHVHQTNVRQVACGFTYRIKEVFTINLIQITFYIQTRLTLASVLGPFILPTKVHRCTIWGYGNFRLKFVMPRTSQHTRYLRNLSYDCDLWKHLVFRLLLALFRLVGLSKRRIIEPSLTAFTGFPFALVFICHGMCYLISRSTWDRRV